MKLKNLFSLLLGLYLGLHNGYLALWETNSAKPLEVFPYHCGVYPKIDQQQLRKGIPVDTQDALKTILGDYLS